MITRDQATKLLRRDLVNLSRKVASGRPLTKAERDLLQSSAGSEDGAAPRLPVAAFARNQADLANALGVNRKTVERWLKSHPELRRAPYRQADGRYPVALWGDWRTGRQGDEGEEGGEPQSLNQTQLRARQILLQNQKLEVQIGVLRREYQRTTDVERWVAEMVSAASRALDSIPATYAPQVIGLTAAEAEARLQEAIDAAKSNLHAKSWS